MADPETKVLATLVVETDDASIDRAAKKVADKVEDTVKKTTLSETVAGPPGPGPSSSPAAGSQAMQRQIFKQAVSGNFGGAFNTARSGAVDALAKRAFPGAAAAKGGAGAAGGAGGAAAGGVGVGAMIGIGAAAAAAALLAQPETWIAIGLGVNKMIDKGTQRQLGKTLQGAELSPGLANVAFLNRIREDERTIGRGAAVAPSALMLQDAIGDFRDSMEPFKRAGLVLGNLVGTGGAKIGEVIADGMMGVLLAKYPGLAAWMMSLSGNNSSINAFHEATFNEAIRQGVGPGAGSPIPTANPGPAGFTGP